MKKCRVCLSECEESLEFCPTCGAELDYEPKEENKEEVIARPVLVAAVEDIVTAEIFKDILNENKIPYSLSETEGNKGIKIGLGGEFISEKIYVDESNLEKAEELYQMVLESEPEFDEFEDFPEYEEEI